VIPPLAIPTLSTGRLTLRPFAEGDLDAFAAIWADEETTRYVGGVKTREGTWLKLAGYLGHWVLRGYGQWAVVETASGRLIGRCGLWNPVGWPELEVGWTLERSTWGQGFATEAGERAIAWAREELGLTRIASCIVPGNERSIAVAERLGMSFDRMDTFPEGHEAAVYAMAL
jgi:RimJ/RimL family protein N-acetyltransferase